MPTKKPSREHQARWVLRNAIARCYRPKAANWPWYGGRGIKVCARWRGKDGFTNFISDMGLRPTRKHELDRFPDKNGDYTPTNCRWVKHKINCRNRRANRLLTHDGQTMSLVEWAEKLRTTSDAIKSRLRLGRSVADTLSTRFKRYARGDERKPRTEIAPRYNALFLTANDRTQTLAEWAAQTGIARETIQGRLRTGWTMQDAVTTPTRKPGQSLPNFGERASSSGPSPS